MALIKTLATIRVPPGTRLVLTFEQAKARAHLLRFNTPVCLAFGPEEYDEDAIAIGDQTLEFKRGEVLGIENPGKDLAGKIEILDPGVEAPESEAADDADAGAEASAPAPDGEESKPAHKARKAK